MGMYTLIEKRVFLFFFFSHNAIKQFSNYITVQLDRNRIENILNKNLIRAKKIINDSFCYYRI